MTTRNLSPLLDNELESLLDDEATCAVKGCDPRPAEFYVTYACGEQGEMCAHHVATLKRFMASGEPVACRKHGKPLTTERVQIRPI